MKWSNLSRRLIVSTVLGLVFAVGWTTKDARAASNTSAGQSSQGGSEESVRNFDDQKVGAIPSGWKVAETGAKAKSAKWEVVADKTAPSVPNVLALIKTENTGDTFNLLVAEGIKLQDLNVEAKVKVISGKNNQGSGVFWRATDPNNYYLARWTPLSNNFRVYCIKDGKARRLANANVKVDRKAWHTIQVNQQGDRIVASLDGKKLIDIKDTTLTKAGMIGLLTKADAAAEFDNVRIQEIRSGNPQQ
jgi:hypothetical protein